MLACDCLLCCSGLLLGNLLLLGGYRKLPHVMRIFWSSGDNASTAGSLNFLKNRGQCGYATMVLTTGGRFLGTM